MPSRRFRCGQESHLEVWEGSESPPKVREWSRGCSGGPPAGLGVVSNPNWRSGRGREAIHDVRNGSGGPSEGPGGVERLSQRSGRPSCRSGSG